MTEINWRGVDLNLLLTFDAVMNLRSVSAASDYLKVGQPATSYNLKRLRTLLNDPLFERQGNIMVPTQRALELAPKVETILNIVKQDILVPHIFKPAEFHGQIVIGLCDYSEQVFGPEIFDQLSSLAPHSKLLFRPVDNNNVEHALETNEIDLAIGVFHDTPASLLRTFLYRERHVCMFDNQVMLITPPISLEHYLATPQVIISANKELTTAVDTTLNRMGKKRNVVLGSTRFLTLRRMLSGRRLIAVMAEMVGRSGLFNDDITLCDPPISIPDFDIEMLTRKRDNAHPQMRWLTKEITHIIQHRINELRCN